MLEIKTYVFSKQFTEPTLENVTECIEIAKQNNCIVKFVWFMKYSGMHVAYVYSDDDAEKIYNEYVLCPHGV